MTALWLLLSVLAASAAYLASAHQRLWPCAQRRALHAAAATCGVLAGVAAIAALGLWAGVFAAATAIMLAAVALPYLDAWRQARRARAHVG